MLRVWNWQNDHGKDLREPLNGQDRAELEHSGPVFTGGLDLQHTGGVVSPVSPGVSVCDSEIITHPTRWVPLEITIARVTVF